MGTARIIPDIPFILNPKYKKINDKRDKEAYEIFKKYRKPHLSLLNPIDLSVYYECWLYYRYKGFFGHKGIAVLNKFSLFYWYSRCFV